MEEGNIASDVKGSSPVQSSKIIDRAITSLRDIPGIGPVREGLVREALGKLGVYIGGELPLPEPGAPPIARMAVGPREATSACTCPGCGRMIYLVDGLSKLGLEITRSAGGTNQ